MRGLLKFLHTMTMSTIGIMGVLSGLLAIAAHFAFAEAPWMRAKAPASLATSGAPGGYCSHCSRAT